jgi:hypothetical protein
VTVAVDTLLSPFVAKVALKPPNLPTSACNDHYTDVATKFTTSAARECDTWHCAVTLLALLSVLCFQSVYGTWIKNSPVMNWLNDKLASLRDWVIPSIWYFQSLVSLSTMRRSSPYGACRPRVSWATLKNLYVKLN